MDDGSKDDTAGVVAAAYGADPRVTVIRKANGGKASALNLGIKQCRGEIIVALDADTVFAPDTVNKLVRHFADPAIGAVSGNVKVGNRNNPLTIWQAVEYITSQNFDRRAFDLLNCITVVPGAVGAWRKDAVMLAGMYSSQTLAEDTDLTFKIRKLGYRIVTDNAALAYTEAPDTLRDLAKQRFRWAFGTLQCLWKHRSALFNPRYGAFGTIAMPSLWVYQIGFQAIAPVVDLTIVWSLIYSHFIAPNTGHQNASMLLGYWALFSAIELLGAWVAFRLDREDKKLLVWLLFQRFVYRQLMYYVIVKSLVSAVRGSLVGWGKFERKGTVQQPGRLPCRPRRRAARRRPRPINPPGRATGKEGRTQGSRPYGENPAPVGAHLRVRPSCRKRPLARSSDRGRRLAWPVPANAQPFRRRGGDIREGRPRPQVAHHPAAVDQQGAHTRASGPSRQWSGRCRGRRSGSAGRRAAERRRCRQARCRTLPATAQTQPGHCDGRRACQSPRSWRRLDPPALTVPPPESPRDAAGLLCVRSARAKYMRGNRSATTPMACAVLPASCRAVRKFGTGGVRG